MMKHRRMKQCLNRGDKNLNARDLRQKIPLMRLCVECINETLIVFQVELSKDNKVHDSK